MYASAASVVDSRFVCMLSYTSTGSVLHDITVSSLTCRCLHDVLWTWLKPQSLTKCVWLRVCVCLRERQRERKLVAWLFVQKLNVSLLWYVGGLCTIAAEDQEAGMDDTQTHTHPTGGVWQLHGCPRTGDGAWEDFHMQRCSSLIALLLIFPVPTKGRLLLCDVICCNPGCILGACSSSRARSCI